MHRLTIHLHWVARTLLFTEMEIIIWVKFLRRFTFNFGRPDKKVLIPIKTSEPNEATKKKLEEINSEEESLINFCKNTVLKVGVAVKYMLTPSDEA